MSRSSLSAQFNQASGAAELKNEQKTHKAPAPFAIRFSVEERAYLEELAGGKPLGTYIREVVLDKAAQKRRPVRKPKIEDEQYAALLASLGASHLSSNLNQLAKHANMGTLDVSRDIEQELHDAYLAVLAMRDALLMALNLWQFVL